MNIELLRTFLEVNRCRHFGKAAEQLHVTQAAVSARIKELESQLGVTLFVRQWRDIQLTPEGHRLVAHADRIISEWRKTRQDVAPGHKEQLAIGGSLRLWDVALQQWFNALRRKLPDLALIAELHSPELLIQKLMNGELDLVFMLEPAQLELIQIKEVAEISLVLISSKANQTVEQALGDGFISIDWGSAQSLQQRRDYPDAPAPLVRVAQAKMALAQMLELGGSAFLPVRMAADELEAGSLHVVAGAANMNMHAYAVYPVRSEKTALIKKTLKLFEYRYSLEDLELGDQSA